MATADYAIGEGAKAPRYIWQEPDHPLHPTGTGGNSSILNREKKLIAIAPSGLEHLYTRPEYIVLLNLDGERQTAAHKVDQLFLPLLEMMLEPLALAKP